MEGRSNREKETCDAVHGCLDERVTKMLGWGRGGTSGCFGSDGHLRALCASASREDPFLGFVPGSIDPDGLDLALSALSAKGSTCLLSKQAIAIPMY